MNDPIEGGCLMRYQESETVELKQDFSENIRKEIIAFANSRGGKIYIGVLDNGEVIGVPSADQMIQRIANTVRDSIKPDVTMFVHYEPVTADDKQIVEVSVNQGTLLPGRKRNAAFRCLCTAGNCLRTCNRGCDSSND